MHGLDDPKCSSVSLVHDSKMICRTRILSMTFLLRWDAHRSSRRGIREVQCLLELFIKLFWTGQVGSNILPWRTHLRRPWDYSQSHSNILALVFSDWLIRIWITFSSSFGMGPALDVDYFLSPLWEDYL